MTPASTQSHSEPINYDSTVGIAGLLGIVTGAVAAWHLYTDPEPIIPWGIEFLLGIIPAVVLLSAAWWLTNHRPLDNDRKHIRRSALIGAIGIGTLAAMYAGQALLHNGLNGDLVLLVTSSTAAGGVIGLTVALTKSTQDVPFYPSVYDGNVDLESDVDTVLERPAEDRHIIATVLEDRSLEVLLNALANDGSSLTRAELVREITRKTALEASEVRLQLHHVTLPKAEQNELITVDPHTGMIEPGLKFEAIVNSIGMQQ